MYMFGVFPWLFLSDKDFFLGGMCLLLLFTL